MRSKDNFIPRQYAPLDVSQKLTCITDNSPATQVYNADTGEYEPNREITPTVIYPDITGWASDNSWTNKQCNSILDEMVWKVNGVDITTIASWRGKYEILQDGSMRGALKVKRNLTREEKCSLTFSAVIPDHRLQARLKVNTEELVLSTYNKTEDTYGLSFGNTDKISYNPFLDKLALYEYKVAHELIAFSNDERNACYDGNQYERSIPLHVFKGTKEVKTGFTIKVFKVVSATSLVDVSSGFSEVIEVTTSEVKFDLRAINAADYVIRVLVKNNVVKLVNNWDEYIATITGGEAAGIVNGNWITATLMSTEDQKGLWQITTMPKVDGVDTATNYANNGGSSWYITSNCKNVELAEDFLASTFGSSTDFYDAILPETGAISCYLPAGESKVYNEPSEFFNNQPIFSTIVEYSSHIPEFTKTPYHYEARECINTAVVNIVNGTAKEDALQEAQDTLAFKMTE